MAYMVVDNDSTPDLEDLMPTDYSSTGLSFGATNGDINLGYQWKSVLSPGQRVNVAITYRLAVPEPTTGIRALFSLRASWLAVIDAENSLQRFVYASSSHSPSPPNADFF
jgi:hypothetical protein